MNLSRRPSTYSSRTAILSVGADLESSAGDLGQTALGNPDTVQVIKQDAERAIDFLSTSFMPAVLVASGWHVPEVHFEFEHLALYQAVAAKSNYYVGTFSRPEAGGNEHYLFIAKTQDLTDNDYLSCLQN